MNGLSLCAGIGGLDLGVERALGRPFDACLYVERELGAAAILAARMEAGHIAPGPIWDDLTTVPGGALRGRVDVITAGIPCQPFSVAGKQRGLDDERWLGESLLDLVGTVEPELVVVENVPGFATAGAGRIAGALSELGFDAEWDLFSAQAVGAPHKRARFFMVAWRVSDASSERVREEPGRRSGGRDRRASTEYRDVGEAMADGGRCEGQRLPEHPGIGCESGDEPDGHDQDRRLGWPPRPGDEDGWRRWLAAGGPAPAVEPGIRRGAHGLSGGLVGRVDRLRAIGNAVVPAQAEYAVRALLERAGFNLGCRASNTPSSAPPIA